MKFNFKIQQYQTDAIDSVIGVFKGQPYSDPVNYRRDIGKVKSSVSYSQMTFVESMFEQQVLDFTDDFDDAGFKNEVIALPDTALLANIREVQQNNNVKISDKVVNNLGRCSLDVEMETGTGKTYVYIKTMYELNKHYSWSKFIVVVPSIAIREGVKKSFEITQDHFMEQYGKKVRFFVYNTKLPKGFAIPTPVGNYSPDWAIAFYEGTVKHIYFIAETKGTMESLELRPIEKAKISCARKLFNEISTENVVYHDVDSYQSLLNIMNSI